jgi:hypothetical protein
MEAFLFEDENALPGQRYFGVDKKPRPKSAVPPSSPQQSPPPLPVKGTDKTEVPYQRKLPTDGPPQVDPPPYKNDPMEDFMQTLEMSMNYIGKVADRTAFIKLPRQHFLAHKDILGSIDNVYRDLEKNAKTDAVKGICMAVRQVIRGIITTLNQATRSTPQGQK